MTGYAAGFEPAMRLALAEAAAARQEMTGTGQDDVPVGAVILDEAGTILARARNRREADRDPTAHAEMVAIRQAAQVLGSWRLTGLTLVVTLEPCTMCAGAVTAGPARPAGLRGRGSEGRRRGLAVGRAQGPAPEPPAGSHRRRPGR